MANFDDRLKDYVQINERIVKFYDEHPEGSLQSEMILRTDAVVVMKAWAYRTPDDTKPGIGHSSCPIPGLTTYTKNSEIENAETSAWGRAIAALGFEVKRGIATQHEIDMKRTETPPPAPASPKPTVAPRTTGPMPPRPDYVSELQFKNLQETAERHLGKGNGSFKVAMWCKELGCTETTTTREQWKTMMEWIVNGEPEIREPGDESQEDLEAGFRASVDGEENLSQDLDAALGTVNQTMNRVGAQSHNGENISEEESRRLFGFAKGHKEILKEVRESFGFKYDRDIPKARYSAVIDAIKVVVRERGIN